MAVSKKLLGRGPAAEYQLVAADDEDVAETRVARVHAEHEDEDEVDFQARRDQSKTEKLKSSLGNLLELQTQIFAAVAVSFGYFTAGMVRAWASPAIPSMQGLQGDYAQGLFNGTDFSVTFAPLSKEEVSWISSLAPLGALFGGLLSSLPLSHFGRRKTLLLSAVLFCLAFLVLGASINFESLGIILMARGISGVAVGLTIPAAQIYVSECSESYVRGTLGSLPALFMSLGTLITYVVGAFFPWHLLSYFCAAFPVVLFVCVIFLPESPSWLINKDRMDEARWSLAWFRAGDKGTAAKVDQEFKTLHDNMRLFRDSAAGHPRLAQMLERPVLWPLFLSLALMMFQQWSGVNAVIFYTVTIFDAAGSTIEKNLATVIVGVVQFVATFGSIFLVDKAGRRLLLAISGLIMSVSLSSVGLFFYLRQSSTFAAAAPGWVPLAGLTLFMLGYSVGFASVPFVLMGELFPAKCRNALGAVSSGFNLLHTFLVIKLFTNLETLVGLHGVFWIYAVMSMLGCLFVLAFLPETKGKTLEDIEAYFRKAKYESNQMGLNNFKRAGDVMVNVSSKP